MTISDAGRRNLQSYQTELFFSRTERKASMQHRIKMKDDSFIMEAIIHRENKVITKNLLSSHKRKLF